MSLFLCCILLLSYSLCLPLSFVSSSSNFIYILISYSVFVLIAYFLSSPSLFYAMFLEYLADVLFLTVIVTS